MVRFLVLIFLLVAFPVHAGDYLTPPLDTSVEVWGDGNYTVLTPNGVGGYEGFDSDHRYIVIETPEAPKDPFELVPREVLVPFYEGERHGEYQHSHQ